MASKRVSIDWNGSVFMLTHNDSSGNTSYKYSYDGIAWETADVPALSVNNALGAKWIGDRMLITGNLSTTQGNVVITSPDGIHYSITKTANGVQLQDVESNLEYRNTIRFPHTVDLALGGLSTDTSKIAYSLDKTATWYLSANSSGVFSVSANGAVWNGRVWVAVGEGGNTLATSNNGDEWTGRGKYVFSERASGVAWSKEQNRFVAVGKSTTVAHSVDGVYWLGGSIPGMVEGKCVKWNGEIWVAGGVPVVNGTGSIAYSFDGKTWTSVPGMFSGNAHTIEWNGTYWCVFGEDSTYTLATSSNGIDWRIENNGSITPQPVYNDPFFLQETSGNTYLKSVDGVSWESLSTLQDLSMSVVRQFMQNSSNEAVANIQPLSIATGEGINTLAYSSDGIFWTGLGSNVFTERANHAVWNGRIWVAVGKGRNWVATSYDGLIWTGRNTTLMTEGYDIAWNGGRFVAVGEGATTTLAISNDGIHWEIVPDSKTLFTTRASAITWTGRTWLAYGSGGNTTARSADGIVWSPTPGKNAVIYDMSSVFWESGYFESSTLSGFSATQSDTFPPTTNSLSFNVSHNNGVYLINGANNPTINLVRGYTYLFEINANGHPFWIQTTTIPYNPENIYSTGITNNGIQSGNLLFDVPIDAPDTLYYVCQYHGSMNGIINITGTGVSNLVSPYLAFDNSANTEWQSTNALYIQNSGVYSGETTTAYNGTSTASGEWIQLSIPTEQVIQYYSISFSTNTLIDAIPREWILLGSNNGSSWAEIHSFAFETETPPNNTWKYSRIVLPIDIYTNTIAYLHYRVVIRRTFGNVDTKITGLNFFMENANTTTIPLREKPVALKNNVLFPFARDYTLADLSLNVLSTAPINGGEYVNSRLYGIVRPPITSVCFDGKHFFLTDVSGHVAYMTNESANTHLNVDTSFNGAVIDSRLSTIYGSCWNQQFVLFGGVGGITYGRLDAGTTWNPTNASRLFSTVYGVASNAGYGFVDIPNAVYLHTNEILRVVGPKAYTMPGETAVKFNLHNANLV